MLSIPFIPLHPKAKAQIEQYCHQPRQLLKHPLSKSEPIAFLQGSGRLGDSLIELVLVNNLVRNGYRVDVYGNFSYALRQWFPHLKIMPFTSAEDKEKWATYPTILSFFDTGSEKTLKPWHPNVVAFNHSPLRGIFTSRINLQLLVCHSHLGLTDLVSTNGLTPLPNVVHRKYSKRIPIHPASSARKKNWPPEKFIALAKELSQKGYEPYFVMTQQEKEEWKKENGNDFFAPDLPSLSDVAAWLYESGYFIGTDSGIGHLASNLGVPTVSIIHRTKYCEYWRPRWSVGEIVAPPAWVNPKPLRDMIWKPFVTVSMVLQGLERLIEKTKKP